MPKNTPRQKPDKKLAIFDLDNTLIDTVKVWHQVTDLALGLLCHHFNLDRPKLLEAYRKAPSQYRFHNVTQMPDWLDSNGHLPEAKTPEEQYIKTVTLGFIAGKIHRAAIASGPFYDDALHTLKELKTRKTAVAVWSDAEAAGLIKRLWHASRKLPKDGPGIFDLIDHLYARPSIECDNSWLRDVDTAFVLTAKQHMSIWKDAAYKPAPARMRIILDDFSTHASEAVMIGDSYKDGGSARPAGVDFAWYESGVACSEETERVVQSICSPNWVFRREDIRSRFNDANRPHVTLQRLDEIFTHYDLTEGNPRKAMPSLLVRHLREEPGLQDRKGLGPATHIPNP